MRIESLFNNEGLCTAYCVWSPRDKDGVEDYNGDYICVDEMWIHESLKGSETIRHFITEINKRYTKATYVYWQRRKYKERIKTFRVTQLTKEI